LYLTVSELDNECKKLRHFDESYHPQALVDVIDSLRKLEFILLSPEYISGDKLSEIGSDLSVILKFNREGRRSLVRAQTLISALVGRELYSHAYMVLCDPWAMINAEAEG
jgi:hypothetical protein